jgi:hypothetical protein
MSKRIPHDREIDGIDRRVVFQCLACAGAVS